MKVFRSFVVVVLAAIFCNISGEDPTGRGIGNIVNNNKIYPRSGWGLPSLGGGDGGSKNPGSQGGLTSQLAFCQNDTTVKSSPIICLICKGLSPDCLKPASGGAGSGSSSSAASASSSSSSSDTAKAKSF